MTWSTWPVTFSNFSPFVATTDDGAVVTWGSSDCGGDSSDVQHLLTRSFGGRRYLPTDESISSRSEETFHESEESEEESDISDVAEHVACTSSGAFATLLRSGSVMLWGDPDCGGVCGEAVGRRVRGRKSSRCSS